MSSSSAELTLILKAQNLAKGAIADVKTAIAGITAQAKIAGSSLSAAFAGKGAILARELGSLATNLLNGQDFTSAGIALGATLAGGVVTAFGEKLVATIAGSALFATISGALTAAGTAIGGLISAAIPIGMAAMPFLLLAAIVGAVAFLIANPQIAGELLKVAGGIVSGILGGLVGLAGAILGAVVAAPGAIASVVGGLVTSIVGWLLTIPGKLLGLGASIVGAIVGGMASLPGAVADIIREAFANLDINVGPFHINGRTGVKIDLPDIKFQAGSGTITDQPSTHARGGWAGLHGPELSWLGEEGPEYVRRAGTGTGDGGGAGVRIVGVSERELVDMVNRGLYFRLANAPTTSPRGS